MRNFQGRGLSREGLNFFGRGDIFLRGFAIFFWEGLRFFREELRFFKRVEIIFGRG